ncbi:membrane protein insertion efficiency factor YidD [Mycobacteroides chelonae]|nr:membrane protein insertion efficiency factor YidD [Mycobacteroides chelonae]
MARRSPPVDTPVGTRTRAAAMKSHPARAVIFLIRLYQTWVSPMRLPSCRFMPTCSQYAVEALTVHGLVRGGWLATIRLLKCGPWHHGGWDPIPERHTKHEDVGHVSVRRSTADV